jgi:hypothetical protein
MQLRDHPAMIRQSGVVNWPPPWRAVGWGKEVSGELGTLEHVSMNDHIGDKIFIAMKHMSERYIAVLTFDDQKFTRQLYSLLLEHTGQKLLDKGDLDCPPSL